MFPYFWRGCKFKSLSKAASKGGLVKFVFFSGGSARKRKVQNIVTFWSTSVGPILKPFQY